MALLFMDSWDHYVTADILEKWTNSNFSGTSMVAPAVNASAGRRVSGSIRLTNGTAASGNTICNIQKTLAPTDATCIAGFGYNVSGNPAGTLGVPISQIRDVATAQVTLRLNLDLTMSVLRGIQSGTVLGTTSAALGVGTYTFIEWKVTIHATAGTVDIRVNGVSVLSLTGQNTRNTVNTAWNVFQLGWADAVANTVSSTNRNIDYDDLYVLDGTGSVPWNAFLGDIRVDPRNMTAAGATTGWTPLSGSNWDNVNDTAPNDDTDYTTTATVGATDTFVAQDAPSPGAAIYGIQHCLSMKKTDAGTCLVAPIVKLSGGSDTPGTDIAPGTTYAYGLQVAMTKPGGGNWTEADFNNAEFGYKRTG